MEGLNSIAGSVSDGTPPVGKDQTIQQKTQQKNRGVISRFFVSIFSGT
jgi:hypothetical protein